MRTARLPSSTAIRRVGYSAVQAATSGYRGTATDHAATIPVLAGEAAEAVARRGSHVQIIAAAGSGKTEVDRARASARQTPVVEGSDRHVEVLGVALLH